MVSLYQPTYVFGEEKSPFSVEGRKTETSSKTKTCIQVGTCYYQWYEITWTGLIMLLTETSTGRDCTYQ